MNSLRLLRTLFLPAFTVPLLLGAGGCATSLSRWKRTHCVYDGAYAAGLSTYRAGRPLDVGPFAECSDASREAALRGYREGYERGMYWDHPASSAAPVIVGPGSMVVDPSVRPRAR